jgi:hypothetical protein
MEFDKRKNELSKIDKIRLDGINSEEVEIMTVRKKGVGRTHKLLSITGLTLCKYQGEHCNFFSKKILKKN